MKKPTGLLLLLILLLAACAPAILPAAQTPPASTPANLLTLIAPTSTQPGQAPTPTSFTPQPSLTPTPSATLPPPEPTSTQPALAQTFAPTATFTPTLTPSPTPFGALSATLQKSPSASPTLTSSLTPTSTLTPTLSPPDHGSLNTPSPTPSPTITPTPSLTPTAYPLYQPQVTACALLPGLPGCRTGSPLPLTGRLAFYDPAGQRLVVVDFQHNIAWAAPQPEKGLIEWSPSGKLLLFSQVRSGDLGYNYTVYQGQDGYIKMQLTQQRGYGLEWNALDELVTRSRSIVTTPDGDQAWMETPALSFDPANDPPAAVHFRPVAHGGIELVWPVELKRSDKNRSIVGWVPGASLLLCKYALSGSATFQSGYQLYTLDAWSGLVRLLPAKLKQGEAFAWNPSSKGLLLLGEGGGAGAGVSPSLALLDVLNARLTYIPGTQRAIAADPSWLADGWGILFAASERPDLVQPGDAFASAAIYRVNRDGFGVQRLTTPLSGPADAAAGAPRDAHPLLLPDGIHFLFTRLDTVAGAAYLRLGSLTGAPDEPVAGPMPLPSCFTGPDDCAWTQLWAYQR